MAQTHFRTCPLCEATCGLEIQVENNQVTGIKGDAADPFSQGYVCAKGRALGDLHHDPDRLRHPVIKKNGKFEKASYEEAFALIAEKTGHIINEYGRSALGIYLGNPTIHNPSLYLYTLSLVKAMRTTNIFSASSVDQLPKQLACGLMYGSSISVPVPDIDRSDYLVILGANPLVSNGSLWTVPNVHNRFKEMQARGGKIVVIDPRKTKTARAADEHHFIEPGTDAYLLMAIIKELFDQGLVQPGHLEKHIDSLGPLQKISESFDKDTVSTITGVDAKTITALAHGLAGANGGAIYGRMGTTTQKFGTVTSWLLEVVNILTGNLDKPGGTMFAMPAAGSANTRPKSGKEGGVKIGNKTSRVSGKPRIFGELPSACLAEEITTEGKGQIKCLFTVAGNPAVSLPGSDQLHKAFEQLDFMVSVDIYINETTSHADVILPGRSPLEDSHFDMPLSSFMVRNHARFSPAIFEKPADMLYEWQVLLGLSSVLAGKGPVSNFESADTTALKSWIQTRGNNELPVDEIVSHLEGEGPDRIIDYMLQTGPYGDGIGKKNGGLSLAKLKANPHGLDMGALKPRIPEVIRTRSGKIELAPEGLMADVERLKAGLKEKPANFKLIGRRHIKTCNSWMQNIEKLVTGKKRSALIMNEHDAVELGVSADDRVNIKSSHGSIEEVEVALTDEIMPGVVCLPHGWSGLPSETLKVQDQYRGYNINLLTDPAEVDAVSGNAAFNGLPVEIVKA